MKKTCFLFVLLTALSLTCYSQELAKEDKNFHFIEAGIGLGLSKAHNDAGTFTVAMSNGLGKYMANFLDYNIYFNKSAVSRHEVSFKIGPYYQLNRYSYVALSAGASILINTSDYDWAYRNGYHYYEDSYQLNIPVQAKINIGLYKGLCFGLKGTYNKMVDKYDDDKGSVQGYVAFGW